MAVNKIAKFEKNNPDIAVNVLFISKIKDNAETEECVQHLFEEDIERMTVLSDDIEAIECV